MDVIFKSEFKKEKNDFIFTNLKRKCNTAMFLVIIFIFSVTTVYAVPRYNFVTITDGNYEISVYTSEISVGDVIEKQGLTLSEYDEVTPDIDTELYDGIYININRIKRVNVIKDGYEIAYYTKAETYGEFLEESEIFLTVNDIPDINPEDKLQNENIINFSTFTHSEGDYTVEISYKKVTQNDPSLEKGKTRLIRKGENGLKRVIYEVSYKNGVEVSRKVVDEYTEKQPIDEIVAVGTYVKPTEKNPAQSSGSNTGKSSGSSQKNTAGNSNPASVVPVSSGSNVATVGGQTFNYKKMITCQATAYDLSFESCGKRPGDRGYGITASGTYAKLGTVAVDPKVIPLGTKMYIVSTDGSVVYGYCTAEDTGGAIKGNKVDLFYNTRAECLQFGRRSVNVYIL